MRSLGRSGRGGLSAAIAAVLAAAIAAAVVVGGSTTHHVALAPPPTTIAAPPPPPPPALPRAPAGWTLVAATHGTIPKTAVAGGPVVGTVPGSWYGYPSILPVVAQAPGWVEVRLAQRPNQATAWVPTSDVTLSSTPYRVRIDLANAHLQVYRAGALVLNAPAGIGTTTDPTVTGSYFMTMRAPAPDSGYGPFVVVTSAHSDAITDYEGSGDAIIAIHGPITSYDDREIGTTGARISHGCVRLHDADLAQMALIPPGSPIDIVAS